MRLKMIGELATLRRHRVPLAVIVMSHPEAAGVGPGA